MSKQKIRIRLKAYDHRVLDQSAERIVDTAKRTGAFVSGPVPLPTEINRFCVNRSPHVDKKSREHFEMRRQKRLIDIRQASPKTVTIHANGQPASRGSLSVATEAPSNARAQSAQPATTTIHSTQRKRVGRAGSPTSATCARLNT